MVIDTGENMYIARGAGTKLPGHVLPSEQKISYYRPNTDMSYNENYQVLTSGIPNIYNWRPFLLNSEHNLEHDGVFVDSSNRFLIVQFHGPINIKDKDQQIDNFSAPILGYLEYKRDQCSSKLDELVAFYMGESFEISYLASQDTNIAETLKNPHLHQRVRHHILSHCHMSLTEKISYLSVYTVPPLSYFAFPEMKWAKVSQSNFPQNAVCASISANGEVFYVSRRADVRHVAINFLYHRVKVDLIDRLRAYRIFKVLVADDPNAFQWKLISEEDDKPSNEDSCDINNSWPVGNVVIKHRKDEMQFSPDYNVLIEEATGKTYILTMTCSPRSLQYLCCNVIVVATMGIPKSIDCLPLPNRLKQYCKLLIS